ncbi:sigma-70 family RNA polymerase sigma factor [Chloroflexota bacterium]
MWARKNANDERSRKEARLAGLYEDYYDRIARYIYVRIGDQSEAEDLAGEVFLKALESLDSYKERGVPMQAWLFKIARNLLVDHLRKVSKRKIVPIDNVVVPDTSNPENEVETRLQLKKMSEALKQLTPAQQEVIGLRFFAGLTSDEVAKILGKKSGAVREMQSAAIKALRNLMHEEI